MEIGNYILDTLQQKSMSLWVWGFCDPESINYGLTFKIRGFIDKEKIKIEYNEGSDMFDISYIRQDEVISRKDYVPIHELVGTISGMIGSPI